MTNSNELGKLELVIEHDQTSTTPLPLFVTKRENKDCEPGSSNKEGLYPFWRWIRSTCTGGK